MTVVKNPEAGASSSAPPPPPRRPSDLNLNRTDSAEVPDALVSDGFSLPSLEAETEAPPAYGDLPDQLQFNQAGFEAGANVTGDGRVNININQSGNRLAEILAPTLRNQLLADKRPQAPLPPAYIPPSLGGQPGQTPPPQLNVVIQIVGSRGDVQPFVALGKVLKDTYGHRVRIATHATFQKFVEENGLEFFCIGGDPAELMAFMVKNPGLMPGFDTLKSGEVSKRRRGIQDILLGCWRSCIEAGNGLGPPPKPHAKDQPLDEHYGIPGDPTQKPFVADAIIANPPSFAHIHIAEKMGIPLHLMFTMPWTPTRAFPHPLANIQSTNTDTVMTNYVSYALVEMMTWQGLGDVINRFRDKALDLEPMSLIWAPGVLTRLRIPYTYCWSPALIPKPNDWGREIDISGFYFLNLASAFTPEPDLAAFLAAGPPPVYIGFGSIVVDDPNALTRMIFDAVHQTGVRALVSKGWGGLGAEDVGLPEGVFMLGNVPHDWLFKHVSAVCHHGGAGTTAAGIQAGKPTIIVPFFGDQPFWGAMVSRAGAGPDPIPYKDLTGDKLAEAIKFAIKPETQARAQELGHKIREEKGTDLGGKSFHDHLDTDELRCSIEPSRAAAWRVRRTKVRLSPMAAAVLVERGLIKYSDLKLYRPKEYITEGQPWDPISAVSTSLVADLSSIGMAVADFPRELFKSRSKGDKTPEPSTPSLTEASSSKQSLHQSSSKQSLHQSEKASITAPSTHASESSTQLGLMEMEGSTPTLPQSPQPDSASLTQSQTASTAPSMVFSPPDGASIARSETTPSEHASTTQSVRPPNSPAKRSFKESMPANVGVDAAVAAGTSVSRIVTTGVKTPMNVCLGLARGFRNAPRLYNDDTVRPPEKVTDLASGIRIAAKEFGYGMFDGIGGLVTQPLKGAEKEGGIGLIKGFGKGIGGLILKPASAVWSVPAYTMQGVHATLRNAFSSSVQNYIIASRMKQGQMDMESASVAEREDVVVRWNNVKFDLKNFQAMKLKEQREKQKAEGEGPYGQPEKSLTAPVTGWAHTRKLSFEERKQLHARKEAWKKGHVEAVVPSSRSDLSLSEPSSMSAAEDEEFERAIRVSVAETSRGNAEEDAAVEQAIRASVNHFRSSGVPDIRAEKATPLDRDAKNQDQDPFTSAELEITDEEYQRLIEEAINQSMSLKAAGVQPGEGSHGDDEEFQRALEQSRIAQQQPPAHEDDEELQRILEESKRQHVEGNTNEDEELRKAIEASEAAHREQQNKDAAARTEEDVVMEYVKKQSLAEEEYRRNASKGKGRDVAADADEEEDEELRRAMEESLKMSGRPGGSSSYQ
ncbi:glycosyltransferase family 28 domain-containing protein [Colletotrichum scovillei]|uniref:Glycosyltransferase family 28 domain-containing protein n=1 Tax=Colletotrichum scovillei TaxID=1209932 RepID=A0A9P7U8W6_9PEZI|nr:glycosyltransferase family 28 domain-containing protein [Colletotrichum scovillei]KAF4784676.1 glycosyltransferase family 28 domain-containing protein [Colletotrichum scovillei]KAG7044773.1 glycosyltransferase family 28 domain-containing protein [Colletotrichum scovillei]KAG7049489.1 glycosyltransferase family 28 domain-containing protein [Colletotrichum scovillei]KAG7064226.1 glycosyltransferase family 28 domain-containing protein [Colletotrichum scovillei]